MPLKGTKSAFSESGFISSDITGTPQTSNLYRQLQTITTASNANVNISISKDGNYIAIGTPRFSSQTGKVEIYANVNNVYTLQTTLAPAGTPINQRFGESVSLNADGTLIVIGAPALTTGSTPSRFARIYSRNGNSWTTVADLTASQIGNASIGNSFGNRVAISQDGNYIVVGARHQRYSNADSTLSGMIYIFANTSNIWTEQANFQGPNITNYSLSETGLQINDDGTVVVASSASSPSVNAYTRSGNTWTSYGNLGSYLSNSNIAQAFQIDNTANIITFGNKVFSNIGNWSQTGTGAPNFLSSDGNIGINIETPYNVRVLDGNVNGYSFIGNIFYTTPVDNLWGNFGNAIPCALSGNADRLCILNDTGTKVYLFDKI